MKPRSDKGRPHERQPLTGLDCIYYHSPNHALSLVITDEGRQIGRKRSLRTHEVADAAEQLVELRDEILASLGRAAQPDSPQLFARFKRAVSA